jgi:hypothetical protein
LAALRWNFRLFEKPATAVSALIDQLIALLGAGRP